jgi:hypothetical protein
VESVDIDETWKLQFTCGEPHPIPEWLSKELLRFNSVEKQPEAGTGLRISHRSQKKGGILNNKSNKVFILKYAIHLFKQPNPIKSF